MARTAGLTPFDTSAAVERFLSDLDHPHQALIEALRALILGVSPTVAEGIKWNAPSYRTGEYFATTSLRVKGGVGIILHLGAKVRDTAVVIDDPSTLLTWHGANRASFTVCDMDELRERAPAIRAILSQWLQYV